MASLSLPREETVTARRAIAIASAIAIARAFAGTACNANL